MVAALADEAFEFVNVQTQKSASLPWNRETAPKGVA
jgi:hypothetical protein